MCSVLLFDSKEEVYFFLIVISPIQFFFQLYSIVTQLHIHVCILFSPIIVLHHK